MSDYLFDINIDSSAISSAVVWGNTNLGLNIIELLRKHGIEVKYILEREKWMQGSIYKGVEVVDPTMILNDDNSIIILASFNKGSIIEMKEFLGMNGVINSRVYTLENLIMNDRDLRKDMYHNLKFQVHLVEHCNLNCRGCDHFSPIAEPEFLKPEEYAKDITRLKELFPNSAPLITLLGGEPLLHPKLTEFMRISREAFNDARIDLITNGVLLSRMAEDFWLACKRYCIDIRPTKYPVSADYKGAEEAAQEYGIKFKYFLDNGTIKMLWKHPLDLAGEQDPVEMFGLCGESNHCLTLDHGRLYTCSVAAYNRHFTKFFGVKLKFAGESNGIDIYKAKDGCEIMKFLSRPIEMCRHCRVKDRTFDNPWGVTDKQISEWT